jgi:hypothetical protein
MKLILKHNFIVDDDKTTVLNLAKYKTWTHG